ncbi:MAG: shufflon system plasmid conjugative transfer pilus tip adhesin PilV [Burkholderiaceae bacterium]|nr:MAG: shufflon system plasmid conjugative transfer pilus tip adhesin PilV [Burkholderiaceae bacterium]
MGLKHGFTAGRRHQRGLTLIEVIVAIAIGLIVLGLAAGSLVSYLDRQKSLATAEWIKQWSDGASQYMSDNAASLLASSGGTVTQATLNTGGYFGTGFAGTNMFGQTGTLHVRVGTGNKLEGLICFAGGQMMTGQQQSQVGGMIGLNGGWVRASSPTVAVGKAWGPVTLSTFGIASGGCQLVSALFVSDASKTDDALHRHAVPGQPQYSQMSTAVDMTGNNINNAGTINANKVNLPGGNSLNIGGSYFYGDSSNIATRSPTGGLYIQTTGGSSGNIMQVHNITGDSGSTFTAQYVSAGTGLYAASYITSAGTINASSTITSGSTITAGGDVAANGAVYASNWLRTYGNTGWYSQTYGGGWYMSDPTWIRAYGDKNIYTGGQVQAGSVQSNGTVQAAGRLSTGEYVQISGLAAAGGGCSPDGLIARASDGSGLVQCQAGRWNRFGGITSTTTVQAGPGCGNRYTGTVITATCPAGYTLTGGGYHLYSYSPIYGGSPSSSAVGNAPDGSWPQGNSWIVIAGGAEGYSCFTSHAVCAK